MFFFPQNLIQKGDNFVIIFSKRGRIEKRRFYKQNIRNYSENINLEENLPFLQIYIKIFVKFCQKKL